jgi:hypothetical protein
MKRAYIFGVVSMAAISCFAQPAKSTFVASLSGGERMEMVKNSIDVPAWHEKSFWHLYEKYMNRVEEVSHSTYRTLDELARTNSNTEDQEAFTIARQLIDFRYAELELRKQAFIDIGVAFNGVIALQYLQTEALLDMMESSRIYETSPMRKYRFYPLAMETTQQRAAKYNTIQKAIALSPDKAQAFYLVYSRYEQECDQLLGEDYSVIGLYAGDATAFTPGLSKRLGHDLLNIMQREIKLKEKFLNEMNEEVGPALASRFLAWEEYHSLVNKMYVWSESF